MTNQINDFILACTTHDPNFRLGANVDDAVPLINDLFKEKCICYTALTSKDLIHSLEENEFNAIESKTMKQVDTYTQVISEAKNKITNPALEYIFYIDLDRLLHWATNFPKELKNVFIKYKGQEYYHIGRSKRAFGTHPPTQQTTEHIVNKLGSEIVEFPETRDIISVCYIINKRLAEKIIQVSHSTVTGFYCTWPLLFWKWAETKDYIEVGGLEWETPDQYEPEIKEIGYDNWLKSFQSQQEWKKRVGMLEDYLTELFNLIQIDFLPEDK